MKAIEKIPIDIIPSVNNNPARRPFRSVYAPSTKAPNGRIKNPAPKVINDSIKEP